VIVLFSSPCTTRWSPGKENNNAIGFGVEIPDEEECLRIKESIYPNSPVYLCDSANHKNYSEIAYHLRRLNLFGGAEDYEREDLFGRQLRYLFGSNENVRTGVEGLADALKQYQTDYALIPNTHKNIDSVKSHKLIQLDFDLKNRVFFHGFVSRLVFRFVFEKLAQLEKSSLQKKLDEYKNVNSDIYSDILKENQLSDLIKGSNFHYRALGTVTDFTNSFKKSKIKNFKCVNHPPIQIWFEETKDNLLLGTTAIDEDTLYYPKSKFCYTVDAILLLKKKKDGNDVVIVNFIQITSRNRHGVSPGAFFAMFILVKLIKIANSCDAVVNFFFVVPEELYTQFSSSEADYLHNLFDDIGIFALKIDKQEIFSQIERDCYTNLALLSFKVSIFSGVSLTLNWSDNIQCVIDNLTVTVNDFLVNDSNCFEDISSQYTSTKKKKNSKKRKRKLRTRK
jgi:hypothetical protein